MGQKKGRKLRSTIGTPSMGDRVERAALKSLGNIEGLERCVSHSFVEGRWEVRFDDDASKAFEKAFGDSICVVFIVHDDEEGVDGFRFEQKLASTINTPEMADRVKRAALLAIATDEILDDCIEVFFEHGQWWVRFSSGISEEENREFEATFGGDLDEITFSVHDAEGGDSVLGFRFERLMSALAVISHIDRVLDAMQVKPGMYGSISECEMIALHLLEIRDVARGVSRSGSITNLWRSFVSRRYDIRNGMLATSLHREKIATVTTGPEKFRYELIGFRKFLDGQQEEVIPEVDGLRDLAMRFIAQAKRCDECKHRIAVVRSGKEAFCSRCEDPENGPPLEEGRHALQLAGAYNIPIADFSS